MNRVWREQRGPAAGSLLAIALLGFLSNAVRGQLSGFHMVTEGTTSWPGPNMDFILLD